MNGFLKEFYQSICMNKTINNIIFNVIYQILTIAIPLITAPYIARVMGPESTGIYSYSTSVANYFAIFMLLGVANYGSRSIALSVKEGKGNTSKTFWEIYILQFTISIIVLGIYCLFVCLVAKDYINALWAQIFYLFSVIIDIGWFFVGIGKIRIAVVRGMILKVAQTACIFLFIKSQDDLIKYILIMSVGTFLGNFILWFCLKKEISFSKIEFKNVLKHIKPNVILFLPLLASSIFVYMDKIMLKIITNDMVDVGMYEYAEKIVRLPLSVISAIGAVMMPKVASSIAGDKEDKTVTRYMDISMRYIGILAVGMSFGLFAVAPELAIVYLGKNYANVGYLMQYMCSIILFSSFANIIRTQLLIPYGKDKEYSISIILGAVVNLVLNALLIPRLNSRGAAIGTICAELTVFLAHIFFTQKKLPIANYFKEWVLFLILGFIMFIAVRGIACLVSTDLLGVIAEILSGLVLYVVLAVILLKIMKDPYLKAVTEKLFRRVK